MKTSERNLRRLIREMLDDSRSPSESKFTPERMAKLQPLVAEALKANSYEEFEKNYMTGGKRGMYWHVTEDPNFFIDPSKGPRDMSAGGAGSGLGAIGDLMISSDLDNWASYYGKKRKYAARVDMSAVDTNKYKATSRGFGNEFYIRDAANSGAVVTKVVTIVTAKKIDKAYHSILPRSYSELKEFYMKVITP